MKTTKKLLENFNEISKETGKKNGKSRQSAKQQEKMSFFRENVTDNDKMLEFADKENGTQQAQQENEPQQAQQDTTQQAKENTLKSFVSDYFQAQQAQILNDLCVKSLSMGLQKIYGKYSKDIVKDFITDTKNGKYSFVSSLADNFTLRKDDESITIKTADNEITMYKISCEIPTTVAAILAKYNCWFSFAKKVNKKCIQPIKQQAKQQAQQEKTNNVIKNASDEILFSALASKYGKSIDDIKKMFAK